MTSYLIKDTTPEERRRIVEESIGIDGVKELREINMEFNARYVSGRTGPVRGRCPEW